MEIDWRRAPPVIPPAEIVIVLTEDEALKLQTTLKNAHGSFEFYSLLTDTLDIIDWQTRHHLKEKTI